MGHEVNMPSALLNFVTMLLEGPGDVNHLSSEAGTATVCQDTFVICPIH